MNILKPKKKTSVGEKTEPHAEQDEHRFEDEQIQDEPEEKETWEKTTKNVEESDLTEPNEMSKEEFEEWRRKEIDYIERKKQKLRRVRREIELEREELVLMRESNDRWHEMELARQQNEERLLDMKRQILENELYKLAEEKKLFDHRKKFYEQVNTYQKTKEMQRKKQAVVRGELFFAGVTNSSSLKKRYKDLLKIYHPDNKYGDTDTIQEINREYQRLAEKL